MRTINRSSSGGGIIHETTAPYTSQQNGVVERKNRALKEMINSMLSYSVDFGVFGVVEPLLGYLIRKGKLWVKRVLIASLLDMLSIPKANRPVDIIPNVQESQKMDDHTDDLPSEIPEPRKEPVSTYSITTHGDSVESLKPNTCKPVDQLEYSRAIGCLMYAMTSTRPDIAYAVGRFSRFTSKIPREAFEKANNRGCLMYLRDASWINHVKDSSLRVNEFFLFPFPNFPFLRLGRFPFHRLPRSKHA
ncbi:zinc finger, CCHC-type containing protein [Tanacetum coccineum]